MKTIPKNNKNNNNNNNNKKTNRFHFAAAGLCTDIAQRTSKRGKNMSHATRLRFVVYVFVYTTFCLHLCVIKVIKEAETDTT